MKDRKVHAHAAAEGEPVAAGPFVLRVDREFGYAEVGVRPVLRERERDLVAVRPVQRQVIQALELVTADSAGHVLAVEVEPGAGRSEEERMTPRVKAQVVRQLDDALLESVVLGKVAGARANVPSDPVFADLAVELDLHLG